MGCDGLLINEHHNTPSCTNVTMNLIGSILARNTRNAKILLLGNVLPIWDNPFRLAEDLAMLDILSNGRLISGFVRGREAPARAYPQRSGTGVLHLLLL